MQIKTMKPEIIILSALVLFVLAGTASATNVISHREIAVWLTTEVEWLFKAALWIAVVVSCGLVAYADPENKAKAFKRLALCAGSLIAFYVVPGFMADVENLSSETNTTSP